MLFAHKVCLVLTLILLAYTTGASDKKLTVRTDVAYGQHDKQTFDVYHLTDSKEAPVIFMVHGGAWSGGDKANNAEFRHKVKHWVSRGFVFISTNYRTLPETAPVEQTSDIESALLFAQRNAHKWGGSKDKFVLMGHSSGAHLVSLFSANFSDVVGRGVSPWLGSVSLDISGYDIVKKNTGETPSEFYTEIFGTDPEYWKQASPFHALNGKIPPFLAVCSVRSRDACAQAENFLRKAKAHGTTVTLMPVNMSHNQINAELGEASCYTAKVDAFLKQLDTHVSSKLKDDGLTVAANCSSDETSSAAL